MVGTWAQQQNTHAGCSKRTSSKAAGDSKLEAYPQRGYGEDFDESRTKLAIYFSTLLGALEAGLQKRGS